MKLQIRVRMTENTHITQVSMFERILELHLGDTGPDESAIYSWYIRTEVPTSSHDCAL